MTRLQPWGESSHGSVKENCVGELFCIPAAPRTPVPLNPCGRTGRLSDRCILCNPSVVSLCHRSKEESLRLKAKRRRGEWGAEPPGGARPRTRYCGYLGGIGKKFCENDYKGKGNRGQRVKRLQIGIESTKLANGLDVVVAPDTTAPVVTVALYYKIGFRLEPQGRSGFAHLFEHMMFQGSANAPKMQHIKLVNSSGGTLNRSPSYR